ncbi:endolytic transglycosylase MltG [Allopusillimonas ginsengisoli]|uniref:endolytic transglycosylase MltG n=1 Tax=Allopusillimonas ginsengisoli TaxID=453575 RepID=UPI001021982D|nr:endolytic transglycosylase MltG [Allopusillimonas ginsengisoli]TEA77617.1 endolytic transglycosylase MltG [Allopusillimonas ginsengisoli]
MKKFKLILLSVFLLVALGAALLSAGAWYWSQRPVTMDSPRIDYIVETGSGPATIARALNEAGIHINSRGFVALARLTQLDKRLQAGAYEALQGDTPRRLLERMANGDMTQTRLTLVEGWTYKRIRQALQDNPAVRQTLDGVSDDELLARLGADVQSPEGLFYPDTYVFVPGTTDYDILRRAFHAQQKMLDNLWAERDQQLPLKTPYEALVLASIVEKETGHSMDRGKVAGVFVNRLKLGMPLQTDPTVIYGMGDAYQGRIRKRDLTTDTPWNTYTRNGLPPTPIAAPGRASLLAVLHPDEHGYLYFVSRGDGTSEFSTNLAAHNRAVAKYILGRK